MLHINNILGAGWKIIWAMNPRIGKLIPNIEDRLSQEDIAEFKIGKAENSAQRFEDNDYADYYYQSVLAKGDPDQISLAESDLIDYFKNESSVKGKCGNERGGSAGNDRATEVYVAAKHRDNEVGDQVLGPLKLFDFDPIQL